MNETPRMFILSQYLDNKWQNYCKLDKVIFQQSDDGIVHTEI